MKKIKLLPMTSNILAQTTSGKTVFIFDIISEIVIEKAKSGPKFFFFL